MEVFALLLTCYCHLLPGSWVPWHITETLKPCPKTILSSPRLPQPPERAASSELRPQLKGLCQPGGTYSLSTAHMKTGDHQHIPGVVFGDIPYHLAVPHSGMPEKEEHLHYSTGKLISKNVHLNKPSFWITILTAGLTLVYPFNSGQKHNHKEQGFSPAQSSPTEHYGSFYWNSDFYLIPPKVPGPLQQNLNGNILIIHYSIEAIT